MVDIGELSQTARAAQREVQRHQAAIETARHITDSPAIQAAKAIQKSFSEIWSLVDSERHQALMHAAQRPWVEMRRTGVFDQASGFLESVGPIQEMMAESNARFSLPEVPAAVKLMEEFQKASAVEALARYSATANEIQRAMGRMHTPWLDRQEALRSITAFAEIQGMGSMLARMPTFDDAVTEALRVDLGDWRDKITWPEPVLTEIVARQEFYMDRGFDSGLTHFPAPAFRESVEIAGLRRQPPPLIVAYGEPVPRADSNAVEEGLVLTNVAHDWLQRLETHLRNFIDSEMTKVFGPDWPKRQLPNGLYEQWMEKREAVGKAGREPKPLIAYADFTDYDRVICKRDNWQRVFKSYFVRPENVRESFQRLHPIRLDTMHARAIGQDDELLLYVEVKRLIRVTFKG